METFAGANNWKLVCRRDADGVTILRAATCDRRAALPETLWGLPVRSLGDRAMAPGTREEDGEEVLLLCGGKDAEDWDNRHLEELTLPDTLEQVGNFAFFRCERLRLLRLRDTVAHWGGSTLMNCRSLDTIDLTVTDPAQETLAYFAGELSGELDVTLHMPDGDSFRLIFPEYMEIYEENCPAHMFNYSITGAGYPYHHIFRHKQLHLQDYDNLYAAYLKMDCDPVCALKLAFCRLRWPRELNAAAAARYRAHLRDHADAALEWGLTQEDPGDLAFLLSLTEPDREALARTLDQARRLGKAQAVALLLEEQHRRFPAGRTRRFAL